MRTLGNQTTTTRVRAVCGSVLIVALGLVAQEAHAKASMCGVQQGSPTTTCTVDDFCQLDPPPPSQNVSDCVAGFTRPGYSFETTIDQDSKEANPSCATAPPGAGRYKMVSDVLSEFWMSDSQGSPWGSLLSPIETGNYPPVHIVETLGPGARFFVGYTTEYSFDQFTSDFRLNIAVMPAGTMLRLGVRNANLAPAVAPDIADPAQFQLSTNGLDVATEDAACQPITYTDAPADISGVDTSLFTWANFKWPGATTFDMQIKAQTGIIATDLIAVVELPTACGSQAAAGPLYDADSPQSFFDIVDGGGTVTDTDAEGEIVFNYTIDPKSGYGDTDGDGCSDQNEDYDDGPFSGFTDPASIGDLVWEDLNLDGVKDPSEDGIENVTLDLYRDVDGDGVIDPEDTVVDTQTTDANGAYDFTQVAAGDYIVVVTDDNNALDGFFSTTNNSPLAVSVVAAQDFNDADFGYSSRVDLKIEKSQSADSVNPGQTLTYTLTVTNQSTGTAVNDVVVTDTLPIPAVSYSSATVTTGTGVCTFASPVVTCTIDSIAGGGTAAVTVVVTVN